MSVNYEQSMIYRNFRVTHYFVKKLEVRTMLSRVRHLSSFSKCAHKSSTSHSIPSYHKSFNFQKFLFSQQSQSANYPSIGSLASSLHDGLDDLQLEFQKLALDFTNTELKPYAKDWDKQKCVSYDTIKKAAELGFGGLYISEENGGLGLSRHDTTLIFEILAQGCVSTTALVTIHNMTAWMLDKLHHDQDLKEEYLQKLINCELMGSYCLTEPHCGSDAAALKTTAKKDGDYYIISGSKAFISGGGKNDLYFTMARTDPNVENTRGITCFLIPYEEHKDNISFGENETKMGWNGSPTATVYFDNVRIHKRYIIGKENAGFKYAMMALDGGRINIAACSLGMFIILYQYDV